MKWDRRSFVKTAALAAGATLAPTALAGPANTTYSQGATGLKISYVIYEHMTPLDLVGPMQIWASFQNVQTQLVAKSMDPMATDTGMVVQPTHTFDNAFESPDILFIPGGTVGTARAASDPDTVAYVADRGSKADWLTSVCTGSLILGAAGLLKGYKAATHWAAMSVLPKFGAIPVNERYVIDRNRATGGGVTAGIDFGLALMAEIEGEAFARAAQLSVEYTPKPPFKSGHPDEALPETLQLVMEKFSALDGAMNAIPFNAG